MTLPATRQRIPALDALRGAALVGMFAFHLTWDLGFFRLIPEDFPYSAGVMGFGHVVAITFLALAGASLVLATRDGVDWRAFGRRLAMIAGAAAAITLGTLYLFPDAFIFFGILHCIGVASVIGAAFLAALDIERLIQPHLMSLAAATDDAAAAEAVGLTPAGLSMAALLSASPLLLLSQARARAQEAHAHTARAFPAPLARPSRQAP